MNDTEAGLFHICVVAGEARFMAERRQRQLAAHRERMKASRRLLFLALIFWILAGAGIAWLFNL